MLAARDIVPPAQIVADGSIHRCDAAGKNGKGDAAWFLTPEGLLLLLLSLPSPGSDADRQQEGSKSSEGSRGCSDRGAGSGPDVVVFELFGRARVVSWSSHKGDIVKI